MSKWLTHITYYREDNKFYKHWQASDNPTDWKDGLYRFPDKPAVYAIYDATKLVYIGSTASLQFRFSSHKKLLGKLHFPHMKISFSRKYGDWVMRELRLIKRLQPESNKDHKRKIDNV